MALGRAAAACGGTRRPRGSEVRLTLARRCYDDPSGRHVYGPTVPTPYRRMSITRLVSTRKVGSRCLEYALSLP